MIAPGYKHFISLLVFFVFTSGKHLLFAQDENNIRLYTANDGLSDDNITGLRQDSYGYIWVCTTEVSIVDGKHFLRFMLTKAAILTRRKYFSIGKLDKDRLVAFTGMGAYYQYA
jgi:hypothetical protein